jgi:glycosyltransferase involved in cell wall biosynthesis
MKSTPLVSVIMPVYNAENYVAMAIQSVEDQTYENWELLIVDDGSTDNSKSVILEFKDPRVKYFSQVNTGVSAARNTGLLNRKGEYICFLDADDQLPVDSISMRITLFQEKPNVRIVDGYVDFYDAEMYSISKTWKPNITGKVTSSLLRLNEDAFCNISWLIKAVPGFQYAFDEDLTHCEDLYFFVGVAETGDYDFVRSPVYRYRVSGHSSMNNSDGLAKGYWLYYRKVTRSFAHKFTISDKITLQMKIRKIMCLTYLSKWQILKGLQYFIFGRTHRY